MATSSKKLLNAEEDVVEQMICGLLACHPTLTRLEGTSSLSATRRIAHTLTAIQFSLGNLSCFPMSAAKLGVIA